MRIQTDLGTTESQMDAKRIVFQAVAPLTATNVEDAINQVQANTTIASTMPPTITPTTVNFAQSPYTVLASDYQLEVDTTGGVVVINLPALPARAGKPLEIKDVSLNAFTNNIQVTGPIEGQNPYLINADGGSVTFRPNKAGSAWESVTW